MPDARARNADVACRYCRVKFLMLLPQMPLDVALQRAEQWRIEFAAATMAFGDFRMQATLSIGTATYPGDGTSPGLRPLPRVFFWLPPNGVLHNHKRTKGAEAPLVLFALQAWS